MAVSKGVVTTEDAVVPETSKVVVISENMNVSVPGEIVAVTDNVEVTGKQTAAVKLKSSDSTTEELAYIVYKYYSVQVSAFTAETVEKCKFNKNGAILHA